MALLALAASSVVNKPGCVMCCCCIGVMGAALFYGDGVITPAISVLSAVEGLEVADARAEALCGSDHADRADRTVRDAKARHVGHRRGVRAGHGGLVLRAGRRRRDQYRGCAARFSKRSTRSRASHSACVTGWLAFVALGAVVLSLTGAEALYADMGHFGARPIRLTWFGIVFPALALNYLGQGALLLADPSALDNPFYRLFPQWMLYPMVGLSTVATVIASQAAHLRHLFDDQAGDATRLPAAHERRVHVGEEIGQIYVPGINWTLLIARRGRRPRVRFVDCARLRLRYRGDAGTMLITTVLTFFVIRYAWHLNWGLCVFATAFFFVIDATFFSANMLKLARAAGSRSRSASSCSRSWPPGDGAGR